MIVNGVFNYINTDRYVAALEKGVTFVSSLYVFQECSNAPNDLTGYKPKLVVRKKLNPDRPLPVPPRSYVIDWTSGTTETVTHNLNTKDLEVSVYNIATGASILISDIVRPTVNSVVLSVPDEPTGSGYKIVIFAAMPQVALVNESTEIIFECTLENNRAELQADRGIINFIVSAEDTELFPEGMFVYEITVTSIENIIFRLAYGKFQIMA
jgi:hypothetical protein